MKIIGLTGLARAGKDTVSKYALEWCEHRGIRAERMALADPLKISAARALGFEGAWTECVEFCDRLKHTGIVAASVIGAADGNPQPWGRQLTGREFLQRYGTEAHRGVFGDEFWVDVAEKRLAERAGHLDVVFLTDVRFDNEAELVKRHGGLVWCVTRAAAGLKDGLEAHASEAGVDPVFITERIPNEGSIEDLRARVRVACDLNIDLNGAEQ